MQPRQKFRKLLEADLDARLGSKDGEMACRDELARAVERAIESRGQAAVLRKYLHQTFRAARLADLSDPDLELALEFVALLEELAPPRQLMPIAPGMRTWGRACWFEGEMDWRDMG